MQSLTKRFSLKILATAITKKNLLSTTISFNINTQLGHIQRLSDDSIPVWEPKLGAQIKGELMRNNISHFTISLTQMRLLVLRHLRKTLKNVELKTLCMPGSATQVCLNVSKCIIFINEYNISVAPVCPNQALDTAQPNFIILQKITMTTFK